MEVTAEQGEKEGFNAGKAGKKREPSIPPGVGRAAWLRGYDKGRKERSRRYDDQRIC